MFQLMSGNYTLPLMGAILALSLTACDKPGTVPDEPNNPTTKQETTESDYVTIVLEDDAGNDVLRALGEGSTNPQVGVYKYKDEFPEALAYIDLPGTKETDFKIDRRILRKNGTDFKVYLRGNAMVASGNYRLGNDGTYAPSTSSSLGFTTFDKPIGSVTEVEDKKILIKPLGDKVNGVDKIFLRLEGLGGVDKKADYRVDLALTEKPKNKMIWFPAETELVQTGTVKREVINWAAIAATNINLINPFFMVINALHAAFNGHQLVTKIVEEPVYRRDVIKEAGLYPLQYEISPQYELRITSLTGKETPGFISADFVYDQITVLTQVDSYALELKPQYKMHQMMGLFPKEFDFLRVRDVLNLKNTTFTKGVKETITTFTVDGDTFPFTLPMQQGSTPDETVTTITGIRTLSEWDRIFPEVPFSKERELFKYFNVLKRTRVLTEYFPIVRSFDNVQFLYPDNLSNKIAIVPMVPKRNSMLYDDNGNQIDNPYLEKVFDGNGYSRPRR